MALCYLIILIICISGATPAPIVEPAAPAPAGHATPPRHPVHLFFDDHWWKLLLVPGVLLIVGAFCYREKRPNYDTKVVNSSETTTTTTDPPPTATTATTTTTTDATTAAPNTTVVREASTIITTTITPESEEAESEGANGSGAPQTPAPTPAPGRNPIFKPIDLLCEGLGRKMPQ
ncbi:hypothetical protein ZTR_10000 [Talaromyces verruculosus]|nr:hypothetical protein ZTR_10000 [Talaromyces verruculosus]